ncbi:MAG: hypothetical protein ACI93R_002226 [Flavobacteriales bacterium]|jgi:hypothetical protein
MTNSMKKISRISLISSFCTLALFMNMTATAQEEGDLDGITMEVVEESRLGPRGHGHKHQNHRIGSPFRDLVLNHMLENGVITQAEIDIERAAVDAQRDAIKAAREAGDADLVAVLREESKAARRARHDSFREYVENNEDLRDAIDEARDTHREEHRDTHRAHKDEMREARRDQLDLTAEERRERREERRLRRLERIEDLREDQDAGEE